MAIATVDVLVQGTPPVAIVQLSKPSGLVVVEKTTGRDGRCQIKVEPGNYVCRIQRQGWPVSGGKAVVIMGPRCDLVVGADKGPPPKKLPVQLGVIKHVDTFKRTK